MGTNYEYTSEEENAAFGDVVLGFERWYASLDEEEFERMVDGLDKYETFRLGAKMAWKAADPAITDDEATEVETRISPLIRDAAIGAMVSELLTHKMHPFEFVGRIKQHIAAQAKEAGKR